MSEDGFEAAKLRAILEKTSEILDVLGVDGGKVR